MPILRSKKPLTSAGSFVEVSFWQLILGDVLSGCGTVGLLGLWLFQQVGIEQRAGELRKISSARADYQTYRSHNAVFNAVNEVVPDSGASERVRTFQTYNYEIGLAAIEKVLPRTDRSPRR